MLKVLKVYQYQDSGKLIADLENGYGFPLNSDLTFEEKVPQRICLDTKPEATLYRISVEVGTQGKEKTYHIIRTWKIDYRREMRKILEDEGIDDNLINTLINKAHCPSKSIEPNAPIEDRIEISMLVEFSEAERQYVGQSDGHPIGPLLIVASFFLFFMSGFWGGGLPYWHLLPE